jgi:hypothetical protein
MPWSVKLILCRTTNAKELQTDSLVRPGDDRQIDFVLSLSYSLLGKLLYHYDLMFTKVNF